MQNVCPHLQLKDAKKINIYIYIYIYIFKCLLLCIRLGLCLKLELKGRQQQLCAPRQGVCYFPVQVQQCPLASMTLASAKTDALCARWLLCYLRPAWSRDLKIPCGTERYTSETLSAGVSSFTSDLTSDRSWCWDKLMLQIAACSRCDAPPCKRAPPENTIWFLCSEQIVNKRTAVQLSN